MPKEMSVQIETKKLEYIRIWVIAGNSYNVLFQINNIFRKDFDSAPDKIEQIAHWVITGIIFL